MRLIDADKLIKALEDTYKDVKESDSEEDKKMITYTRLLVTCFNSLIAICPTVKSKVGSWIKHADSPSDYYVFCSECNYAVTLHPYSKEFNFCPNCGADMRGES